jgi:hypothetical protein
MKAKNALRHHARPQTITRTASRVKYKADVQIGDAGERSMRIRAVSSAHPCSARSEIVVPQARAYEFMELVIHMVAEMDRHRK